MNNTMLIELQRMVYSVLFCDKTDSYKWKDVLL